LQQGDRDAWSELYARYHDQLLLTIRLRLGRGLRGHLQSEDILQSVALEAFLELGAFEYRGAKSLERFLSQLVIHKIRDRADTFGAQKRAGTVPLDERLASEIAAPESDPLQYLDAERYERLERGLNSLPTDLREVLVLRKFDGLSSQEIAARLGKSDEAVRKTYSRALARLSLLVTNERPGTNP
jgi:RNA polymerase sigma-70 factor (ECF subfamily)